MGKKLVGSKRLVGKRTTQEIRYLQKRGIDYGDNMLLADVQGIGESLTERLASEGFFTVGDARKNPEKFAKIKGVGPILLKKVGIPSQDIKRQSKASQISTSQQTQLKTVDDLFKGYTPKFTEGKEETYGYQTTHKLSDDVEDFQRAIERIKQETKDFIDATPFTEQEIINDPVVKKRARQLLRALDEYYDARIRLYSIPSPYEAGPSKYNYRPLRRANRRADRALEEYMEAERKYRASLNGAINRLTRSKEGRLRLLEARLKREKEELKLLEKEAEKDKTKKMFLRVKKRSISKLQTEISQLKEIDYTQNKQNIQRKEKMSSYWVSYGYKPLSKRYRIDIEIDNNNRKRFAFVLVDRLRKMPIDVAVYDATKKEFVIKPTNELLKDFTRKKEEKKK